MNPLDGIDVKALIERARTEGFGHPESDRLFREIITKYRLDREAEDLLIQFGMTCAKASADVTGAMITEAMERLGNIDRVSEAIATNVKERLGEEGNQSKI